MFRRQQETLQTKTVQDFPDHKERYAAWWKKKKKKIPQIADADSLVDRTTMLIISLNVATALIDGFRKMSALKNPLMTRHPSTAIIDQIHIHRSAKRTIAYQGMNKVIPRLYLQAISKKGFWSRIAAEAKFKPEAYSGIPRI